ncbi:hypothetical protein [Methylobacterium sp. WL9]|uniref:hypothetical protein n=1 Tax=Methylobacterium sp. WL9 TaxID=2603898 RepID=UPI0011CCADA9|nr:hypothetical protein [Methylobacterium sp. WL9]TXN23195.1 hypothetical protein FV217_07770 [Methylobacterium sp. WL9]
MFNRWFSARWAIAPHFVEQDQDAVALPIMAFLPMAPVVPPDAQNDDAFPTLYESVERDLKAAGYLA